MATHPQLTVRVDPHLCEGHALCLHTAPRVFDLSEDEIASCTEHPDVYHLDDITAAAAACPRQAITVEHQTHEPDKDRS